MATCNDCNALKGAKSATEPHENLKFLRNEQYKSDGMRNANRQLYVCLTCGTGWSRDMDVRDKGAIWEVDISAR